MKDKTKRSLLIAAGALLCVALVFAVGSRLGGLPQTDDPAQEDGAQDSGAPVVDIDTSKQDNTSSVNVNTDKSGNAYVKVRPGAGADSSGTEQTIQADPVKPEAPEPPAATKDGHTDEDIPKSERNAEVPPTYAPEQTTVTPPSEPKGGTFNDQGQMYVPGFGYIDGGGESTITVNEDMYENGNKVGIMD